MQKKEAKEAKSQKQTNEATPKLSKEENDKLKRKNTEKMLEE